MTGENDHEYKEREGLQGAGQPLTKTENPDGKKVLLECTIVQLSLIFITIRSISLDIFISLRNRSYFPSRISKNLI